MGEADTDEMLMLRYKAGDAAAFEPLFSRHNGAIYRYFLRQIRNSGQAEELAQDVWQKVVRSAATYEVVSKFNTWLYRIAHNRLIDHVRGQNARPEDTYADPDEEIESHAIPEIQIPDRHLERRQLAEQLVAALNSLPADQREAFLLHEEGEMTLEEIATTMGVGRETIKSRLRYAINKLRTQLKSIN